RRGGAGCPRHRRVPRPEREALRRPARDPRPRGLGFSGVGWGEPLGLATALQEPACRRYLGAVPAASIACRQAPTAASFGRGGRAWWWFFSCGVPAEAIACERHGTVGACLAGDIYGRPCAPMQSPAGRLLQRLR